ncbi:MAG: RHS repeat domain-containing protein [Acidimicrobiales bacterium]
MKPSRGQRDTEHRSNAQLTSIEDFFGTVTSFGYGARGLLTSITCPSATGSSITYAYDQASQASTTFASSNVPNCNGTELCWSINALVSAPSCGAPAPSGATYYFYTSDGQLSNIEPTSSSQASATASYAWDPLGHMCWSAPSYVSSPTCSSPPSGATSSHLLWIRAQDVRYPTRWPGR